MGLDIYLYRSKNYKKHLEFKTLQEQIDNAGEDAWPKDKKYDELTPAEKEKYSADSKVAKLKKAKELGVKVDEKAEYSWDMIKDEYEEEIKEDNKKECVHCGAIKVDEFCQSCKLNDRGDELIADLGDEVYCDICNEDYTTSKEEGGFVFGSTGYCPKCAGRGMTSIKKYNEEQYITATANPGETFHDLIMRVRNGNNKVIFSSF